jgi:hypothetical protein
MSGLNFTTALVERLTQSCLMASLMAKIRKWLGLGEKS